MEVKQPTQEQIKELWEWCGIGYINGWLIKDREWLCYLHTGIDLNNLFKLGTPKARETIGADELSKRMQGWISDVILCGINPETSLFYLLDNIRMKRIDGG